MNGSQIKNPLHGLSLEMALSHLVERYKCFTHAPGSKPSLKFLRKTPGAGEKVEALYLQGPGSAE